MCEETRNSKYPYISLINLVTGIFFQIEKITVKDYVLVLYNISYLSLSYFICACNLIIVSYTLINYIYLIDYQ